MKPNVKSNGTYTPTVSHETAIVRLGQSTGLQAAVAGEVSQAVATAKAFPRELGRVYDEILYLATLDEETAASCFYRIPRGGKVIEGPSARMAEILASAWGNMRIASRIVEESDKDVVCEAVAWDLEKNVAITAQVSRKLHGKKDYKTGKRGAPDADEINLAKMSGQSIARRNAILQVIPGAWIKGVMREVREVAIGDVETLPRRREMAVEHLAKMGVKQERVLEFLERETVEDISGEDLLKLRTIVQSIRDGNASADKVFVSKKKVAKPKAKPPTAETDADDLDDVEAGFAKEWKT